MSATWARLRLGRVYHRALSLALSTASTAPTEGPPTPKGHLTDSAPFARAPHVRASCLDLRSSERLIPAHGTHAESWAYRGGHISEGALASTDAPHEESGCALLAGLPPPRRKPSVPASGIKLHSNKMTEETQGQMTSEEEGLKSNVKVKLLLTRTKAVDSIVSDANPVRGIEPKSDDIKLPSNKSAEETRVQLLIPGDPASDVLSYVDTSEPVGELLFSTQSDSQQINSESEKSTQLAVGRNVQFVETGHDVVAQFSNSKTLSSGSLQLSSKDSGFHGTHSDPLVNTLALDASDPATKVEEHPVLSITNSSHSFASFKNVCGSEPYATASFTPICELIIESDSDSTASTSSSNRPELNLDTNPSNGLDLKADDHEPSDSKEAAGTSAGMGSEPSFLPPPPPPPMPPL